MSLEISKQNLKKSTDRFFHQNRNLTSLQQRARRLLAISSSEDQDANEDVQQFCESKANQKSLRKAQYNKNQGNTNNMLLVSSNSGGYEKYQGTTDIALLKRCINLTQQNNQLKISVSRLQEQKGNLQGYISQLKKQIKQQQEKILQLSHFEGQSQQNYKNSYTRGKEQELSPYQKYLSSQYSKKSPDFKKSNTFNTLSQYSQRLNDKNLNIEETDQKLRKTQKILQQTEKKLQLTFQQLAQLKKQHQQSQSQVSLRLKAQRNKRQKAEKYANLWKKRCSQFQSFILKQLPMMQQQISRMTFKVDQKIEQKLMQDENNPPKVTKIFENSHRKRWQ